MFCFLTRILRKAGLVSQVYPLGGLYPKHKAVGYTDGFPSVQSDLLGCAICFHYLSVSVFVLERDLGFCFCCYQ